MMKKYADIVLVAIFSSVITLIAYTFVTKDNQKNETENIHKVASDTTTFSPLINASDTKNAVINKSLLNFKDVVKRAKSTVVHVRNTRFVQQSYPYYFGYGRGQVQKQEGTGSGVIISPDGYIVTNNHVIKGANELSVTLDNNKIYKAELIGTDPNSDIAIIKIDAIDLPYMTFGNSDHLSLGEWVLAIGNPYNIGTTVTAGIVSAKARDLKGNKRIDNFIQTDAAVNPGNSGGALLNTKGELIGINTMIFSMNGSFIGYSFAIPSNVVKKIVDDILEYGSIQKGVLGIKAAELNDDIAKKLNIDTSEGVYIYGIEDNENNESTLQIGDIIIKIDDVKVASMADLLGYLRSKRPGDKIEVIVLREGDQKKLKTTLKKNNAAYLKSLGLSVKNVDQKILNKYGVLNGVYIDRVNNRLLYQNGITPGYIITKINNTDIHSVDDITSMLDQLDNQRYTIEIVSPEGRVEKYIFR